MIDIRSRIRKIAHTMFRKNICENVNNADCHKHCLLLYVIEPFIYGDQMRSHQNVWQIRQLVKIIGEFGYNVDVLDYRDRKTELKKKYDLIIDIHPGLNDAYNANMTESCKKIAYLTGSNPAFSNKAEADRLDALFKRKGVRLKQRRYVKLLEKSVLESFDAFFFLGNGYNLLTYEKLNIGRAFYIRNTGYDYLKNTDFSQKSANNFLFLASSGQVHKGLDLLLEVFAANKNMNLYVCSGFKSEKDFCEAYADNLQHSSNVFPIGFIDIASNKFRAIIKKCSYVVLPSCSEANAGSVLTAMSAGLIPIVSRECGFESDEVYYLKNCSLDEIGEALRIFSEKDMRWIESESLRTLDIVRTRYSEEAYCESVRQSLIELLGDE